MANTPPARLRREASRPGRASCPRRRGDLLPRRSRLCSVRRPYGTCIGSAAGRRGTRDARCSPARRGAARSPCGSRHADSTRFGAPRDEDDGREARSAARGISTGHSSPEAASGIEPHTKSGARRSKSCSAAPVSHERGRGRGHTESQACASDHAFSPAPRLCGRDRLVPGRRLRRPLARRRPRRPAAALRLRGLRRRSAFRNDAASNRRRAPARRSIR